MVNEEAEIRIGTEEDAKVVAAVGVYDDKEMSAYVDDLGQKLAAESHRPNLKYTFRIIDTPVLNAFALPGGFIYITRGTLAHLSSTDELAGVMGHEVGHVVARHSAEQISKGVVASGFGVLNLVSRIAPVVGGLISAPSELLMRSYSRGDEAESDELGVEYATKLGYDAHELTNFFHLIEQITEEEGGSIPTFLSTHPAPGKRVEKVNRLADEWQSKVPFEPREPDTADYLKLIDGIVFGDDPRQGYVEEGMFYHPNMEFQFAVPLGWQLANAAAGVQLASSDEKAMAVLVLDEASTPRGAANSFVSRTGVKVISERKIRSKGLDVYALDSALKKDDLKIVSFFIAHNDLVFAFHSLTRTRDFQLYGPALNNLLKSFERATDPAVLGKEPLRVRLSVANGEFTSLEDFARNAGVKTEHLRNVAHINGRKLGDPVKKGETIKILLD